MCAVCLCPYDFLFGWIASAAYRVLKSDPLSLTCNIAISCQAPYWWLTPSKCVFIGILFHDCVSENVLSSYSASLSRRIPGWLGLDNDLRLCYVIHYVMQYIPERFIFNHTISAKIDRIVFQLWKYVRTTISDKDVDRGCKHNHYIDVIMGTMTSQITSLTIVYPIVYSGADQRKHQSSVSLAFVRGIHRWSVNSTHKAPVTPKMFPLGDVIM